MTYPFQVRAEVRIAQLIEFSKWFAIWAAIFAVSWFAIHLILGAVT